MTDVALPSDTVVAQRAQFISQTTAVEQARAVAEVQAAVLVAQSVPRQLDAAVAMMRESCQQKGLAERAFFKFPRGGTTVAGPSVHLARELARCWGNVQYGIQELRRDDIGHYSEMQAWAWDVQTNTRSSQTFVVPHKRDKRGGPEVLIDLRDIYENNANQGSRRLREAIFSILPTWFTEEAKDLCNKTLVDGGGKSLPQQIADALAAFEGIGIKQDRIVQKLGPTVGWNVHDVAHLRVAFKSIQQGTVSPEEEFPQIRVTSREITGTPAPAPSLQPTQDPPPSEAPATGPEDSTAAGDDSGQLPVDTQPPSEPRRPRPGSAARQ
jgi:hypothetical protein